MDQSVVERAKGGDRDAFDVLIDQVSDSFFAVAFRILRETGAAEDALQNALMSIWQQLPHLREVGRFEAWSRRILVHACYDEFRSRRQFTNTVRTIDFHPGQATDGSRVLADRDELEQAFAQIPVDQRAVFVMHHYLGLPLVEIADTLGIPAGTARSRLHNATRALRSLMVASAIRTIEEGQLA